MDAQDLHVISLIEASPLNQGVTGAAWLARPGNFPVVFENGDVILFEDIGDRIFHPHYLFKARGRAAMYQVEAGIGIMFREHDATAIAGFTPANNRAARIFNRWMGAKSLGFHETPAGLAEKFILTRHMWKVKYHGVS